MRTLSSHSVILLAVIVLSFALGAFTTYTYSVQITKEQVQAASAISGLSFTDPEIDDMLSGLDNFRSAYDELRQTDIPNALPPALQFNPLPMGFELNTDKASAVFRSADKVSLPENLSDLAFYSIQDLASLIRTRQISSENLTRFFIDRLKKYDKDLHCVITLTEELALEQARKADAEIAAGNYRGLLHGIPYGAKDLLATRNYLTTWGAMPYKDQSFGYDATVIQKLEAAGAVLVAKLTLGALAMGDVWFGERTRNPWNTETGSSGSSAGSASAVAAGLVPFAIGTETLGSIVSPSTTCGVTGLRPTFGRVSKFGAMALSWSMDKIGPITRHAEDAAIVFEAIYGPDGQDMSVIDAAFNYDYRMDPKKLRIGYLAEAFENSRFRAQDSISLEVLRSLGYELVPITLPELPNIRFILTAEAAAAFDELTRSDRDDLMVRQGKGAWPNTFRSGRMIPAVEYIQANRLRSRLIEQMDDLFEDIDLYVHPSWGNNSLTITNFTGHPCVVVPNGFQDNGLPSSISFTGSLFGEADLLRFAETFQQATDFHTQHPEWVKD
jgi:Asp-tRNA(Asn)/Glu-tRNA(Gln) amidotransferase A subunit family amidase